MRGQKEGVHEGMVTGAHTWARTSVEVEEVAGGVRGRPGKDLELRRVGSCQGTWQSKGALPPKAVYEESRDVVWASSVLCLCPSRQMLDCWLRLWRIAQPWRSA